MSDRVTVLRGGKAVATVSTADATPQSIASLMVGRELETVQRRARRPRRGRAGARRRADLGAESHRATTTLVDVDLTVHAGEIVAIAGVAGQRAARAGGGDRRAAPRASASCAVGGRVVRGGDPRAAYRAGPRLRAGGPARHGRRAEPVALDEHRAEVVPRRLARPVPAPAAACGSGPSRRSRDYDIKATGPEVEADTLSGGNIQKVVLAREFAREPEGADRRVADARPRRERGRDGAPAISATPPTAASACC